MTDQVGSVEPIVYVVDDDLQACRAVAQLVHSFGYQVRPFHTPTEFLENVNDARPGCVVLDIRLPGIDGLQVHQQLRDRNLALPVIIMTAFADTMLAVHSMRNGAVSVLDKPFRDDELWSCVQEALRRSELEQDRRRHIQSLESRLKSLSSQDRAVLQYMLQGLKNRSIAKRLDVSLRTVENRRRRVFDVMQAESVAQLTRMIVEYEHSLLPMPNPQGAWLDLPFERAVC